MPTAARIALLSTVTAAVLVVAWFLAPTSLGGSTTYLSTHGTSMEPGFRTGDLAVLRSAGSYEVGDVVAYPSPDLGRTVIHRIVDRDGDRFVTQGDNNSWRDEDRPAADDLAGALWFRIPQGGTALGALTSPWTLAAIGAAATLVLAAVRRPRSRRGRSRGSRRTAGRTAVLSLPALSLPALSLPALSLPALSLPALSLPARALVRRVALAGGVVGVLAVTGASALLLLPDTRTTSHGVPVTQDGRFTYSGEAVAGTTYPDGRVTTGDPVYTTLAHVLTVSYEHQLSSTGDLRADGEVRLDLALTAPDGWSTELPGGAAVPLRATGGGATAVATVELNTAIASGLLAAHYDEVGAEGGAATLTVSPALDVDGTLAGQPFAIPAPTPLTFTLEPTVLRLAGDEALTSAGSTTVTVQDTEPRVFHAGPVVLPIEEVRVLALGAAAVAALVAVVASWLGAVRTAGPAEEFLVRHAGRVIPVARFAPEGAVVDVADPETLYTIANRLEGLVLHSAGPDGDTFAVRDVGTTYRCVLPHAPLVQRAPRRALTGRLVRRFA